jgi:hypothetical protein
MTKQQQEIVNDWVQAGLMQPSPYWPFTQYDVKQLAKDQKVQQQKQRDEAGEALL